MARAHLTLDEVSYPHDADNAAAVKAKSDEHDAALDALEGGTTSSIVTIHPVRAAATADVANLAACSTTMDTSVTLVAGDRVLLPAQNTASQNGIYVVGTVGGGTAPLTRATDFDAAAEVKPQTLVAVAAGTANGNSLWGLNLAAAPTIGATNLPFVQILNKTQLATYLALTTQAGLIGSDAAGYIAATVKGQLAEVKVLADAAIGIAKKTVTVNDEDAGMTGASYAVNIGTALPANAIVFAHEIAIVEQFAGEADTTITIGGTDADAIVASTDLDALGAGSYMGTLGVHPVGKFSTQQLVATFAATALEDLSAGQCVITVWYSVLA